MLHHSASTEKLKELEVLVAKQEFLQLMKTDASVETFKIAMGNSDKYFNISMPIFSFLENYKPFSALLAQQSSPKAYLPSSLIKEFISGSVHQQQLVTKRISKKTSYKILEFYKEFIGPSAPPSSKIPYLSEGVVKDCAEAVTHGCRSLQISNTMFDRVALLALTTLFAKVLTPNPLNTIKCFPKYLIAKNKFIPIMKSIHANWEKKIESQLVLSRKNTHKAWPSFSQKPSAKPGMSQRQSRKSTKEALVYVLRDPILYAAFCTFAKNRHCLENLLCYDAFVFLDHGRCLEIFLGGLKSKPRPISSELEPLYLLFYKNFMTLNTEFEVNLTSKLKLDGAILLEGVIESPLQTNVLDEVSMHVLDLIFLSVFPMFLNSEEYNLAG